MCFMLVYFAQGGAWLFRRTAGRGPCPRRWRTKTHAPPRGSKDERVVVSSWPLKVCYRGLVCHGAKWQRWKKANPEGSLKRFFRLREQRALKAREDIRAFWEGRGVASAPEGPLPPLLRLSFRQVPLKPIPVLRRGSILGSWPRGPLTKSCLSGFCGSNGS